MKNIVLLFVVYLLSGCTADSQTEDLKSNEKFHLKVTSKTTYSESIELSAGLKAEREIKLNVEKTEFDENGQGESSGLNVESKHGFEVSTKVKHKKLIINEFGFEVDSTAKPK